MSITDSAAERLRQMLRARGLQSQQRLPPERELAEELGVSRGALRSALAQLEAEGRIWRHVGRGTFIGARPAVAKDDSSRTGLFAADTTNPQEVMEARLIFEPRLCALAAHRATPAHIAQMQAYLRRSVQAEDVPEFERWDGALHLIIAEAAGNRLLADVFRAINAVRDQKVWGQLKKQTVTHERRRVYIGQHEAFVGAIRDRDAKAAHRLMREHLATVYENLLGARYD